MSLEEMKFWEGFWEKLSYVGFAFVILGVALESAAVWAEFKKRKHNGSILEKDGWGTWWCEAASVIIVVLALAFELIASLKATGYASDITNLLSVELKSAKDAAGKAIEHAALIGTTNAQLSLRIEELRKENLNLAKSIAWRVFVGQNWARTNLARFKGVKAIISVEKDDKEAEQTAAQIRWVLEKAGWQVSETDEFLPPTAPSAFRTGVPIWEGVIVATKVWSGIPWELVSDSKRKEFSFLDAATSALVSQLNASTIATTVLNGPLSRLEMLREGVIFVHVGRRPTTNEVAEPFFKAK